MSIMGDGMGSSAHLSSNSDTNADVLSCDHTSQPLSDKMRAAKRDN